MSRLARFARRSWHKDFKVENMKKIVVLTGAGMSAESGLSTFLDADGLWENYPVRRGPLVCNVRGASFCVLAKLTIPGVTVFFAFCGNICCVSGSMRTPPLYAAPFFCALAPRERRNVIANDNIE